jgi:ferredoxin-NADP reductase
VLLDGPYGILSVDPGKYASLLLVAGGIGITPMHCILQQIKKHVGHRPSPPTVKVVWVTRDFRQAEEEFGAVLRAAVSSGSASVAIHSTAVETGPSDADALERAGGVNIFYGRPDWDQEMRGLVDTAEGDAADAAVLVCGPSGMLSAVHTAAKAHGVHIHKETFEL